MILVHILLLFGFAHCQITIVPQLPKEVIPIISYMNEIDNNGSYKYSYETENGITVEEEGSLKPGGEEGEGIQTARGSYSYTAPDGRVISVTWYADETGFHAEGDHIPKPPEQHSSSKGAQIPQVPEFSGSGDTASVPGLPVVPTIETLPTIEETPEFPDGDIVPIPVAGFRPIG